MTILIQTAQAAKQNRVTFYRSKYNHWKMKLGSENKAKVAVTNRIARAVYKFLSGDKYKEIRYQRAIKHKVKIKKLINQLRALGPYIKHEGQQKIFSSKRKLVDLQINQ